MPRVNHQNGSHVRPGVIEFFSDTDEGLANTLHAVFKAIKTLQLIPCEPRGKGIFNRLYVSLVGRMSMSSTNKLSYNYSNELYLRYPIDDKKINVIAL